MIIKGRNLFMRGRRQKIICVAVRGRGHRYTNVSVTIRWKGHLFLAIREWHRYIC